eukprot:INCI9955.7.p1 GENE.INCI9955.7~~INCI9955.7.p1  ORF type:complete len:801 (+),score=145.55 INCI9955.7:308-2710(+)
MLHVKVSSPDGTLRRFGLESPLTKLKILSEVQKGVESTSKSAVPNTGFVFYYNAAGEPVVIDSPVDIEVAIEYFSSRAKTPWFHVVPGDAGCPSMEANEPNLCGATNSFPEPQQQKQLRVSQRSAADDGITNSASLDVLSVHDMATKKTEIFLRLSSMFPTVQPDLVTMLLDDFAWDEEDVVRTLLGVEALDAADAVSDASLDAAPIESRQGKLSVAVRSPSDQKLAALLEAFPSVDENDVRWVYHRNSKNADVAAQKLLSRLNGQGGFHGDAEDEARQDNGVEESQQWPSLQGNEALADAKETQSAQQSTVQPSGDGCAPIHFIEPGLVDEKLASVLDMFPGVDPDLIAAIYFHNSKSVDATVRKVLSRLEGKTGHRKKAFKPASYSAVARALPPAEMASRGVVPIVSSAGDFPNLALSHAHAPRMSRKQRRQRHRQGGRTIGGICVDGGGAGVDVGGGDGFVAEADHEAGLSDFAKRRQLLQEFEANGLTHDEVEDMLVRQCGNLQRTRFALVEAYASRLPRAMVENYKSAALSAREVMNFVPARHSKGKTYPQTGQPSSTTTFGTEHSDDAEYHREQARVAARAMQRIIKEKMPRTVNQRGRSGRSLRRGGGRGGRRKQGRGAGTRHLGASAQVAFMDEHRVSMREHNAAAARAIFVRNNGGTVEELLLGRQPRQCRGKRQVFDLHGLFVAEAISIVSAAIKLARDRGIQRLSFVTGVGRCVCVLCCVDAVACLLVLGHDAQFCAILLCLPTRHSDPTVGPRLLPHVKAYVKRCARAELAASSRDSSNGGEIGVRVL